MNDDIESKYGIHKSHTSRFFSYFCCFYEILTRVMLSSLERVLKGSAMVLGKLPVPERPTYLNTSRIRAYCANNRCGLGLFGLF